LDPASFRKEAHDATDWIVEYLESIARYPVMAKTRPGEIKARIPKVPPEKPEKLHDIMQDFQNIILPGITHWNHPRFFAYFSITSPYAGIIGEMLSSALNVNAMLWKASPSATELEEVATDWVRQMVGLPPQFEGVINDTASVGSLCAMAAAREYANLKIRRRGLAGRQDLPKLTIYASEEAHSSIEKAAIVLGFGQEGLRKIPTDEAYRMKFDALKKAVKEDVNAGLKPICVVSTIGTTSTTSIDPIKEVSELCREYKIWLHIDAAYAGAAATIKEMRDLFEGWEMADSIVVNPHKWLFTTLDCSILYCRQPEILRQAFSLTPEYLRTPEATKNMMDYGVSLGRRFRALKLWMIIRSLGTKKIANTIREHITYAHKLEEIVRRNPNFELLAPVPFSTLVFRLVPDSLKHSAANHIQEINDINEKLLDAVNQTGQAFLSHTKLRAKYGIRFTIGNIKTTWEDVNLTWKIIKQKADALSRSISSKS
jgi:aromatic-L-amino-acid decarboxylase